MYRTSWASTFQFEYTYHNDGIEGSTVYTWSNGAVEKSIYVHGVKNGPSEEIGTNGDREVRDYVNGVLQGKAVVYGAQGDKLEFNYK